MIWPRLKIDDSVLPDIKISQTHIDLRPARADDYMQWALVREKNYPRLKPFEPSWAQDALTPEFFERRMKRQVKDWQKDKGYCFLVIEKNSNSIIGGMNINNVTRGASQHASLGYWIDVAHEGRGYMREAVLGACEYGFDVLRLKRMNAACLPHNERSKNLLLSTGFEEEGYAKRYLQIDGQWQDHILFGRINPSFMRGQR